MSASNQTAVGRRGVVIGAAVGASALTAAKELKAATPTDAMDREPAPRRVQSFDDDWLFHRGEVQNGQASDLDDSGWRLLDLPHDWSIEDLSSSSSDSATTRDPNEIADTSDPTFVALAPRRIGPFDADRSPGGKATAYTVGGVGWYRKHFELDADDTGMRLILIFGGSYENTVVWLNGERIGVHRNGYTPFSFDITKHARLGENVLAIRVRNEGQNSRWYSGSGIYRHAWLRVANLVHIPDGGVAIVTPAVSRNEAIVDIEVEVRTFRSESVAATVRATFTDPEGRRLGTLTSRPKKLAPGRLRTLRLRQQISRPSLWWPDTPALYTADIEILVDGETVDQLSQVFGVRSLQFDGYGFRLNGELVKLRGGCIHHDHGPLGAVSLYAAEERRIQTLKDAGFNAIRYSHQCPSRELLTACDRIGMMVYDEFTDMWDSGKTQNDYHRYFANWWKRDARAMIRLDRNHPSVIMRGIGNEVGFGTFGVQDAPPLAERGAEMANFFRKLDPTRPVVQGGGDTELAGSNSVTYCDIGDVHYERDYSAKAQAFPDKAWVQSESYIGSLYEYWQMVADNDFAIGDFSWTAWDYLGESAIGHPLVSPVSTGGEKPSAADDVAQLAYRGQIPYPWWAAGCGDVDFLAELRPQMRYRRVVWGLSELELLVQRPTNAVESKRAGWAWCDELESWTWDVAPNTQLTVRVYTGGDEVELRLNGRTIARRSVEPSNQRMVSFSVKYEPGALTAVSFSSGEEVACRTLRTVGAPAAILLRPYRTQVTTSRDDLVYVTGQVLDSDGRLVPDAVINMHFGVGGGELVGVISGNGHNAASFKRPHRWTYHGKAMVVVKPPRKPGSITITAFADGLKGHSLEIDVVDKSYPESRSGVV